jgi:tetratricopeptide (TPR) repeat protein
MVALVAGMITTTWQSRIVAAERDQATAARDFLVDWMGGLDPDELGGQRIFTHEDLVEQGLSTLDRIQDQPQVRAPIMNTLAQVFFNLGERERGAALFADARALLEPMGRSPNLAVSLMGIGLAHQRALRFTEAVVEYRQALDIRRAVLEEKDPAIAESMASLAFALYSLGATPSPDSDSLLKEARSLYLGALDLLPEPTVVRARAQEGLGDIDLERGRRPRTAQDSSRTSELLLSAERSYRDALQTSVFVTHDTTPDDARRMWGLATALRERGRVDDAIDVGRRALAVLVRTYGAQHPDVAMAHYSLGTHLYNARLFPDAANAFERSSEISAANESVPRLYAGDALVRAGQARLEAGQPVEALEDFERSIPFYESSMEAGDAPATTTSARIAAAQRDRGRALTQLGNHGAALVALRTAFTTWSQELSQPQITPGRARSVSQSMVEVSTLLAEVFYHLQQPDSASHYRARAASLSSP